MKDKGIENILSNSGRLILRNYFFGERFFVENDEGHEQPLMKSQFYKFKETCANKDESQQRWFSTDTSTWYYWRN